MVVRSTPAATPTICLMAILLAAPGGDARAQCAEEPPFQHYTGGGTTACPCFLAGEEAGAVFQLPAAHYPVEILRVGIGWGSQFGGNPQQIEQAIHVYAGGLPDPGAPIFTLPGPQMTDGAINEFDLEPLPGEITVASGPVTVTLEFLNTNSGDIFAPTVVHDGNGCQAGANAVQLESGQWADACALGVTGDWVFYVVYRSLSCGGVAGAVPDGDDVPGTPLTLTPVAGGDLQLQWGASCSALDTDYEVYEGILGNWYSHFSEVCSTGGATQATITPLAADTYYLVVPHDREVEGSYGTDGAGAERPQGGGACLPRVTGACR